MPALDNISWERIAREDAVTYPSDGPDIPGRDVVFDQGFPRPGGVGKLVAAKLQPPDEVPDSAAYLRITDSRGPSASVPAFLGWMFANAPGVSMLEHPVYDIRVIECRAA